jgi:TonB family protein
MKSIFARSMRAVATAAVVVFTVAAPSRAAAQDASKTYTLEEVDTKPSLASMPSFQRAVSEGYPDELKRRRLGGIAEIQFVVDASGKVEASSVEIVDATQPAFGEAAKRAVMTAGFKPGKMGGTPVRTKVTMPIVYRCTTRTPALAVSDGPALFCCSHHQTAKRT